jgi:glycosyltransferase involved in cell wall biosynthesis
VILVLCNESPWPVRSGGRVRLDGLIRALRLHHEVQVVVTRRHADDDVSPDAIALPTSSRSRAGSLLGPGPRLGRGLLDDRSRAVLAELSNRAHAVVVSQSYLAAELPRLSVPVVVDLQNLEVARQQSVGSWLGVLEAAKARRWEPRAVRAAHAVVCVDRSDAQQVESWGARRVVVVPNVAEVPLSQHSPENGTVLAVADWRYGPNVEALSRVLDLAPRFRAPFVLAGRGSETYGGLGFVEDLAPLFDAAAVVVSPVLRGGGTQLKIIEALTRGRVVVTTPYGARSVPPGAEAGCVLADGEDAMVGAVNDLLSQPGSRHQREAALQVASLPRTWEVAAEPLIEVLAEVACG